MTGVLKGYDQLLNLVLDDVTEDLQCELASLKTNAQNSLLIPFLLPAPVPQPHTRKLGLVVLRGPTITVLNPVDGFEEIDNPFGNPE